MFLLTFKFKRIQQNSVQFTDKTASVTVHHIKLWHHREITLHNNSNNRSDSCLQWRHIVPVLSSSKLELSVFSVFLVSRGFGRISSNCGQFFLAKVQCSELKVPYWACFWRMSYLQVKIQMTG